MIPERLGLWVLDTARNDRKPKSVARLLVQQVARVLPKTVMHHASDPSGSEANANPSQRGSLIVS